MKRSKVVQGVLVLTLSVLSGLLAGCSKSDKGTAPVTEPFESGDLGASGTFVHTFGTAGNFSYHCRRHNGMNGSIEVAAAGADSAVVPISDFAFGAPTQGSLPIKTGGKVRWINTVATLHTVTRP